MRLSFAAIIITKPIINGTSTRVVAFESQMGFLFSQLVV